MDAEVWEVASWFLNREMELFNSEMLEEELI
jgi:hypothetical protein